MFRLALDFPTVLSYICNGKDKQDMITFTDFPKVIFVHRYSSPCGELLLGEFDNKLCLCDWVAEKHHDRVVRRLERELNATITERGWKRYGIPVRGEAVGRDLLKQAKEQLDEYFAGERRQFDVPLLFVGTDFQKRVWSELLHIPYGETVSYGEIARRIGMPSAVRAVANANGANAISIFAPCHRVIGSDGSLTGYGGGLDAKRYLLALEQPRLFK